MFDESPSFREVQRFRQPWLWLLLGGIVLFCWYASASQFIMDRPLGNHPANGTVMFIVWLIFGIFFPIFIWSLRLETEVRDDGLYIRFFPFHWQFLRFGYEEIAHCEPRTYRPLMEYGGWGIRYGWHGKAYNVCGNRGLQLEMTDRKRILIGSQRVEELYAAILAKYPSLAS